MAVPISGFSLQDVNNELNVSGKSLIECIALAGKTGVWTKLSDFSGYSAAYLIVAPISISFSSDPGSRVVTVDSNVSWEVIENIYWISVSKIIGTGNDTFTVSVTENFGTISRSATIYVESGAIVRSISIFQDAASGGC